ncbi:MAG: Crp/Fnr family transcriptional regulator [Stellaceae bacterium]
MTKRPAVTKPKGSDRPGRARPVIAAVPFTKAGSGVAISLLDADQTARLVLIGSIVEFPKGARLYQEGDEADCIYNVIEGEVKTFCALSSGRRCVTAFLFPGDLAGLAGHGRYVSTAQAVTRVAAYSLPLKGLDKLLRHDPELQHHFLCKVCSELRASQSHAIALGRQDADGKLAMFLHELDAGHAERPILGSSISLPMTRSDVADYLGLSLEAVSRSFRKLRHTGMIGVDGPHRVQILDRARFERLVAAA